MSFAACMSFAAELTDKWTGDRVKPFTESDLVEDQTVAE